MDNIRIRGLRVFAHHGVLPEETSKGQIFYVYADLYFDIRKAGMTDELKNTVNYGEVCHMITSYMQENTFQLIETVAENLAREVLLRFSPLQAVRIEICKPNAPIGLPFQDVSVSLVREWHKAYIAFGSNIGDRVSHIENGIRKIRESKFCKIEKISQYLLTKPYGVVEQEDFLNGVMEVNTMLPAQELLEFLQSIEEEEGRKREIHWGPRTLDLDIVFYDKEIIDTETLVVPHPDMHNRNFVLQPMAEIAPYFRHPLNGKTVGEMVQK